MVKTRITNCRFKRFTSQPIVKHRKIQRKQKRFLVGFFRKEEKLKCKALSILET
jgi:hypothetical protein